MSPRSSSRSSKPASTAKSSLNSGSCFAVDGVQAREPLALAFERLVDPLLLDALLGATDLEALVVAELGFRQHADLDRELQLLALGRQVGEVEVDGGVADGHDARA